MVVAQDGNKTILPIAFAIVEEETLDVWCENLSSHSLSCQLFDLVLFLEVEGHFHPLNCVMALE